MADVKKVTKATELTDDELDQVAGGYSKETWTSMSYDERVQAKEMSDAFRTLKMYCAMDDPNA